MSRVNSSLNFTYKVEQFATRIYLVQKEAFSGSGVMDKLTAASANEQTHVDNLQAQILELKIKPSWLDFLFKMAAVIFGAVTLICGRSAFLKADVLIEQRAIRDYGNYNTNWDINTS
jgi:demethoxyubiquinone hydroxylase (CLK1/Coq7/Cat5 family)